MAPTPSQYTINKWWTFAASQLLLLISGLSYTFPLWCQHLKVGRFGYDQTHIELIASIADITRVSSSIAVGVVFNTHLDAHPLTAPRLLLLAGAAATAAGYGALWAALRGVLRPSYWQVAALVALGSSGSGWTDIAPVALSGGHFAHCRGTVLALAKAWVGLSARLCCIWDVGVGVTMPALSLALCMCVIMIINTTTACFLRRTLCWHPAVPVWTLWACWRWFRCWFR